MAAAPKRVLRVLGVMGSPHIKGNSDTLLDRALEGVTAAAAERGFECKVEKVVLATKQVTPCHYCAACHKSSPAGGPCPVKDDMVAIAEQFLAADIVLHSFPVWFFNMPGIVKGYLDRWTQFYTGTWELRPDIVPRLRGKVLGAIAVCGDTDHEGNGVPALLTFQRTAEFGNIYKWAGGVSASGGSPGDIAKDTEALARAFNLGKHAVSLCQ